MRIQADEAIVKRTYLRVNSSEFSRFSRFPRFPRFSRFSRFFRFS